MSNTKKVLQLMDKLIAKHPDIQTDLTTLIDLVASDRNSKSVESASKPVKAKRPLSAYNKFVKDNYSKVTDNEPKQRLGILAQMWKQSPQNPKNK